MDGAGGPGSCRPGRRPERLGERVAPPGPGKPRLHAARAGPAAVADLRRRHRLPAPQQRRRRLVPPDRDLRPARAVLHAAPLPRPLPRADRRPRGAAVRLAEVRPGDRIAGARRPVPGALRGAAEHVRRPPRGRARRDGPPRDVGGHHARRLDRPRLPAGGARPLGQGADAVVPRARQHPVLRLGPPVRKERRTPLVAGAAVDRPGADPARPVRPGAGPRHARAAAGRRRRRRPPGEGSRPLRGSRRPRQRHRRPPRVHARRRRPTTTARSSTTP